MSNARLIKSAKLPASKSNKTNPKGWLVGFVVLSHDKRFYRQPEGGALLCTTITLTYEIGRDYYPAASFSDCTTYPPVRYFTSRDGNARDPSFVLAVKATRNSHTWLFSKN